MRKRVPVSNADGTVSVPLTQGKWATVDSDDLELVSRYNWHVSEANGKIYAATKVSKKTKRMHQILMPDTAEVDHRDGDGLNNRRLNLRSASHADNTRNRKRPATNTSGFKGVSWNRNEKKWKAKISVDGKELYLGWFSEPEAAARAYDTAALQYFGEFARLNFAP